jgi:hypothetical protein
MLTNPISNINEHKTNILDSLNKGRSIYVDYQPGDGTAYKFVLTPLWKIMNHPEENNQKVLLSLYNGTNKCYTFGANSHKNYIAEKLSVDGITAEVLSKFLFELLKEY